MEQTYPIHDLYIQPLSASDEQAWSSLEAYAFDDHLLKRIGRIEILGIPAGESLPPFLHEEADELWVLISGDVEFSWQDKRENSPTLDVEFSYQSNEPVRVLVPFGVKFGLVARRDSQFMRVSTHHIDLDRLAGHQAIEDLEA